MASNDNEQIKCIASIIHSFHWKRVIAIYESDKYGGDLGLVALLSEELQKSGSEIEYRVVLPPFSSLPHPERFVRKEIDKLLRSHQARVFVVLHSSLPMATYLFREAKEMRLLEKDSAWIMTESISSLLDSTNSSFISSAEGSIGVKTYFSNESRSFLEFKDHFRQSFRLEYPKEDILAPGIHALRAYDSIGVIKKALDRLNRSTSNNSTVMLNNILLSNFSGLSGPIGFHGGESSLSPTFRVVNVVGKRYKEVGFWSSKLGFFHSLLVDQENDMENRKTVNGTVEVLASMVDWPGKVKNVPKGWAMPSDAQPMKIGVPGRTTFQKFVKVDGNGSSNDNYSGFCIDVFNEVLQLLDYYFPYKFHPFNGTYDDLVLNVINKTFDGVIGDVTILANRSKYVEFTQPYSESSLTVVGPVKSQAAKAWIFLKPFTVGMWMVTGGILIYTMSIVWLLERQTNPEFEGPWRYQLCTALWFTFSSLFFAHRERVHSNYTRVVVLVWLFVALALSSSYTASLTSMLTVSKLQPDVTDIESLKRNNEPIGCDGDSFIRDYLKNVLNFKTSNIKNISEENDYPHELKSGNITAALLELPYEKAFLNHYCKGYTGTILEDRFGGLGFVFQKGSPIAADFSEAILALSENGRLKHLEAKWFDSPSNCSADKDTNSLSIKSFWGLYLFSGTISTICFVLFYVQQLRERSTNLNINNIWYKIFIEKGKVTAGVDPSSSSHSEGTVVPKISGSKVKVQGERETVRTQPNRFDVLDLSADTEATLDATEPLESHPMVGVTKNKDHKSSDNGEIELRQSPLKVTDSNST